jgi:hypothetical protein
LFCNFILLLFQSFSGHLFHLISRGFPRSCLCQKLEQFIADFNGIAR